MSPHHSQLVINGQKRLSSSGETFETYHPGTKQHTGHVESASSADVREAIQAASAAFPAWERVLAHEKRNILNKAADLLESEKYVQRLIESVAQEIGAVAMAGAVEAHLAARQLREGESRLVFFLLGLITERYAAAAQAAQIVGETFPSGRVPGATVIVQKRPYGVVSLATSILVIGHSIHMIIRFLR